MKKYIVLLCLLTNSILNTATAQSTNVANVTIAMAHFVTSVDSTNTIYLEFDITVLSDQTTSLAAIFPADVNLGINVSSALNINSDNTQVTSGSIDAGLADGWTEGFTDGTYTQLWFGIDPYTYDSVYNAHPVYREIVANTVYVLWHFKIPASTSTTFPQTGVVSWSYSMGQDYCTGPTGASLSVDNQTFCQNADNQYSTDLYVAITGGKNPYTIVYSDGTSNFTQRDYKSGDSISVSPTGSTTYYLVSVTDSISINYNYILTGNGGSYLDSKDVTVTDCTPPSNPSNPAGCASSISADISGSYTVDNDNPTAYIAVTVTGGTAPYNVLLDDEDGSNANISGSSGTIAVSPCETTTYQIYQVSYSNCLYDNNNASFTGSAVVTYTGSGGSGSDTTSIAGNIGGDITNDAVILKSDDMASTPPMCITYPATDPNAAGIGPTPVIDNIDVTQDDITRPYPDGSYHKLLIINGSGFVGGSHGKVGFTNSDGVGLIGTDGSLIKNAVPSIIDDYDDYDYFNYTDAPFVWTDNQIVMRLPSQFHEIVSVPPGSYYSVGTGPIRVTTALGSQVVSDNNNILTITKSYSQPNYGTFKKDCYLQNHENPTGISFMIGPGITGNENAAQIIDIITYTLAEWSCHLNNDGKGNGINLTIIPYDANDVSPNGTASVIDFGTVRQAQAAMATLYIINPQPLVINMLLLTLPQLSLIKHLHLIIHFLIKQTLQTMIFMEFYYTK